MKKLIMVLATISLMACGNVSNTVNPEYIGIAVQLCAQYNLPATSATVEITDNAGTSGIITARCGEDLTVRLKIKSNHRSIL